MDKKVAGEFVSEMKQKFSSIVDFGKVTDRLKKKVLMQMPFQGNWQEYITIKI